MHSKSLQSCLTLCDPLDCSPLGSSVLGAWQWDSVGKNTGMGCHSLLQGDLPDPGIEPASLISPALAGGFFTTSATWEAPIKNTKIQSFGLCGRELGWDDLGEWH